VSCNCNSGTLHAAVTDSSSRRPLLDSQQAKTLTFNAFIDGAPAVPTNVLTKLLRAAMEGNACMHSYFKVASSFKGF